MRLPPVQGSSMNKRTCPTLSKQESAPEVIAQGEGVSQQHGVGLSGLILLVVPGRHWHWSVARRAQRAQQLFHRL